MINDDDAAGIKQEEIDSNIPPAQKENELIEKLKELFDAVEYKMN